jgi:hypothetical protein
MTILRLAVVGCLLFLAAEPVLADGATMTLVAMQRMQVASLSSLKPTKVEDKRSPSMDSALRKGKSKEKLKPSKEVVKSNTIDMGALAADLDRMRKELDSVLDRRPVNTKIHGYGSLRDVGINEKLKWLTRDELDELKKQVSFSGVEQDMHTHKDSMAKLRAALQAAVRMRKKSGSDTQLQARFRSPELRRRTLAFGGEIENHGHKVEPEMIFMIFAAVVVILLVVSFTWKKAISDVPHKNSYNAGRVFGLGADGIKSAGDVFKFLAPFANEITNVITITLPLNLYPHHPHDLEQNLEKTFIDLIALMGIAGNAAYYGQESEAVGSLKAHLLLIFSFVIPNLFMGKVLGMVGSLLGVEEGSRDERNWRNWALCFSGLFMIYILDILINTIWLGMVGDVHPGHDDHSDHSSDHSLTNATATDHVEEHPLLAR